MKFRALEALKRSSCHYLMCTLFGHYAGLDNGQQKEHDCHHDQYACKGDELVGLSVQFFGEIFLLFCDGNQTRYVLAEPLFLP